MSRKLLSLSVTASLMAGSVLADVPNVAVDIAPVHSLVARVMEGVGTPALIMQQGASPHEYSLRPSEAQSLQDADLVFWVSADLSPWLGEAIEALAPDAASTELMEANGTIELETRSDALFEKHVHGDEEGHDDDHDDHDEDDHDDHGKHDPHSWLSPQNAMTWMNVIAGEISAADPENAGAYFANAAAGRGEIEAAMAEANATLEPVRGGNFVVFHDAYQYFENDFDFPAAGAISISDASDPSPARIAEIQARIADEGIDCVFAEPQFNPDLIATVLNGAEAETGVLDPLGSHLDAGPAMYPQLILDLSAALAECM
ncbi:zinc ABC transporter substrate-binding protein [Octadecabacter sp. 1_MG-2023]|uniref:zinc ABC transporter substrate-binding protein n=1 Tax=unclassified Octadecabacter TaxID=196158 RepID=UPI001C089B79|nr:MULTISPECIES: zinc ABC transporter substrate-binding protein [unclassified Octadecabacter]MBU2991755.1 zinc ABC transporter substrate-binding protein [Octadecabacter sp. B2R22]MDO6735728.1 zinc ABC transporter substrate-binding protein [Octadecabacter sp. 1_MG-2023]